MKKHVGKRAVSLLLSVLLLLSMMTTGVIAVEAGTFILVAESGGKLVIAPEYVSYIEGQTVREALVASGHTFTGLENDWVTEIDGVVGNYTRSDGNGGFDLNASASEVEFYRFSEDANSQPSDGLQQLMTAMAEYKQKAADVQAAAKAAYDTAYAQFVGIDSESAVVLADALNTAVSEYENAQTGTQYRVTFTDGTNTHTDVSIAVENAYGKTWTDDGDGVLELPAGDYTFCINRDGLWVDGQISISGDMTVTAALPNQLWLDLDTFRLSGSYGAEDNEENKFSDDEYTLEAWNDRQTTVAVSDTFTGKIYTYAKYRSDLLTETPTLTAVYEAAQTGVKTEQAIPFESLTSGVANVLVKGSAGNTVIYRVSSKGTDGYTYSQDYTVTFARVPSLISIRVADQNGVDQTATTAFDGNVTNYTYKVVDSVTSVTVKAQPLDETYNVMINGQDAGEGVTVELAAEGNTTVCIEVAANGYVNSYTLTICPGEGKKLSFVTESADVTLEVVNSNGEVMPYEKFKEGTSGNRYQYTLVPGETYSYVATAGTYFHIADEFTMEDVADSTIQVDVPMEDWLSELSFGTKSGSRYKDTIPMNDAFSAENHSYQVEYVDTEHYVYAWLTAEGETAVTAIYDQKYSSYLYHEKEQVLELTSGAAIGTQLKRFLMDENPIENTLTIRLTKERNGITYYQDYVVEFTRTLTLKDISAESSGSVVSLIRPDGDAGFDPLIKEYSATISMAAEYLDISFARYTENTCYGESDVGYRVKVEGVDVTEDGKAQIALDGTIQTQTVTITVENDKAPNGSTEYVLNILKSPPVETSFEVTPEDSLLTIYNTVSGERLWADDNGCFQFCEGYSYAYAMTKYGYISKSGTLNVTRDEGNSLVVMDGDNCYIVEESEEGGGIVTIPWSLEKAPVNDTINAGLSAQWPDFRGSDTNNGVVSSAIPTAAEDGILYWANQIGSGIDADAVGSPIIVDGYLITYASDKIYRVDTVSGEVVATGTMDHKSSFSITPPAYAEGMVFVALSNGTVQAFNAETLESLWLYADPLGGQPNCPLTVKNGYLYTGFWNSETSDANFVCLSITDEDPAQAKESKCASWYHTSKGGFYWAGAYASDNFVLVGTDDGTNTCTAHSSSLLAFDPITGKLLDSWDGLNGDIRSTIVYDSTANAYYFTSKGGSFYSIQMAQNGQTWEIINQWSVGLQNGSSNTPMSTCSPVVYNGRAYVGVSGAGQFAAYSGHNITVIDLSKQTVAYSVQTQGYPQTSGLLTTAYEEESGYVYIYFFDNMTPGKLRVLRDKAGQTSADYITAEGSYSTAYALFTPTGDQAQYAICSPIADEYGTIYFKNDSAYLMAFGSAIKKIEVTTQPDKVTYADGEAFDPTGMVVTAIYANGKTRDITQYVTFDVDTVTAETTQITVSFPYVMYHNEEDGTAMNAGVASTTPTTILNVTVENDEEVVLGDVNQDGKVNIKDKNLITAYFNKKVELTDQQLKAADVNGDGRINIKDANLISAYFNRKISVFPAENE